MTLWKDSPFSVGPHGDGHERLERARKRVQQLRALYVHALVYVVVNLGLFLINVATRATSNVPQGTSSGWWFYWPLLAWGIGLAGHAAVVLFGFGSSGWEDRKIRELMNRELEDRLHPRPAT